MSIHIKNLTKVFGEQKAVDDISFEIKEGEIVGFLGPNGAGKSTTMKIANGYLPPSQGEVFVANFDVVDQSLQARMRTGYLPEHNPLYLDMYMHEFLKYAGKLYGLKGKKLKDRLQEMIQLCGLEREQNKKLEELSKGYRQRVGLAQALLHDPEVLILDEPTTGLDPNQILEIRELIKNVAKNKTVILSTHIMQEVQAICDRVIVINKGRIVADSPIGQLMNKDQGVNIVVEFEDKAPLEIWKELEEVLSVSSTTDKKITITAERDIRNKIMKIAAEKELLLVGLQIEEMNLETVFRQLTSEEKS